MAAYASDVFMWIKESEKTSKRYVFFFIYLLYFLLKNYKESSKKFDTRSYTASKNEKRNQKKNWKDFRIPLPIPSLLIFIKYIKRTIGKICGRLS